MTSSLYLQVRWRQRSFYRSQAHRRGITHKWISHQQRKSSQLSIKLHRSESKSTAGLQISYLPLEKSLSCYNRLFDISCHKHNFTTNIIPWHFQRILQNEIMWLRDTGILNRLTLDIKRPATLVPDPKVRNKLPLTTQQLMSPILSVIVGSMLSVMVFLLERCVRGKISGLKLAEEVISLEWAILAGFIEKFIISWRLMSQKSVAIHSLGNIDYCVEIYMFMHCMI